MTIEVRITTTSCRTAGPVSSSDSRLEMTLGRGTHALRCPLNWCYPALWNGSPATDHGRKRCPSTALTRSKVSTRSTRTPAQRRAAVTEARMAAGISERQACRFTGFARSTQRYATRSSLRSELRARLQTLAELRPHWGYRRLQLLLRREGCAVNPKVVQRLYREEGLSVPRRKRKRVVVTRRPILVPSGPNERWSMDFVSDALGDGRKFSGADHCGRLHTGKPSNRSRVLVDRRARSASPRAARHHTWSDHNDRL
jgi:transposase InsO family protein